VIAAAGLVRSRALAAGLEHELVEEARLALVEALAWKESASLRYR
jgi:hypothetical protein